MKKYGFINTDDGKSVFVHESGLKEGVEIDEGDRVSFDVEQGQKGPAATNVTKI